jgi:hypothetical protein
MKIKRAPVLWLLAWLGAALGLLHLGTLPGDLGHYLFADALCGPWG